jgi:hypothetical protein
LTDLRRVRVETHAQQSNTCSLLSRSSDALVELSIGSLPVLLLFMYDKAFGPLLALKFQEEITSRISNHQTAINYLVWLDFRVYTSVYSQSWILLLTFLMSWTDTLTKNRIICFVFFFLLTPYAIRSNLNRRDLPPVLWITERIIYLILSLNISSLGVIRHALVSRSWLSAT